MTAPDVLYLRGDQFYTDTARAWDARNLRPLVDVKPAKPLAHRDDCIFRADPTLAIVCPCTADQRYAHRSRSEVAP